MAEYIDSSVQNRSEYIRYWLDKNLVPSIKSFRVQSGYFSYSAIEPFEKILKDVVKKGNCIRLVIGSNSGSLMLKDAKAIFKILKGKKNCSFTVVALRNAEFHTKCYQITRNDGTQTALVGSGNLTAYGIAKNIEAGVILDTSTGDDPNLIDQIRKSIEKWANASESDGAYQIRTMKNLDVLRQSKIINIGNIETRIPSRGVLVGRGKPKKTLKKSVKSLWSIKKRTVIPKPKIKLPSAAVLMSEIPKGSSRWGQANFDKYSFQHYFGFTIGNKQQYVILQHVNTSGKLGNKEKRPGVSVKSRNYRIELAAAKGLTYPSTYPPIGIFVRDNTGNFRYCLLMPNDPNYSIIANYLTSKLGSPINRMRRNITDYKTLKKIWPNSPL